MAVTEHYMGAQEHSINTETFLNYHRYVPQAYVKYDLIVEPARVKLQEFWEFIKKSTLKPGYLSTALLKKNDSGIWFTTTDNTFAEDVSFHAYSTVDYRTVDRNELFAMFGKTQPELMITLLLEDLDIGLEGISVSPSGEMQKCIFVFRPNSHVLSLLNLPNYENMQKFVDLSFVEFKTSTNASTSFSSPIRLQIDPDSDTISVEFVSAFFQKDFYISGGNHDSYLNRKNLYFERMLEAELLTADEVAYCKTNSPSWQQFSIKFKYSGGELVDKKLYTFDVSDFETVT
jgi:hypothetical protein